MKEGSEIFEKSKKRIKIVAPSLESPDVTHISFLNCYILTDFKNEDTIFVTAEDLNEPNKNKKVVLKEKRIIFGDKDLLDIKKPSELDIN